MLKNKKKLRRIERNTPGYAVKTAQSLVLAGALVGALTLGGVSGAMAAVVDITSATATITGANALAWGGAAKATGSDSLTLNVVAATGSDITATIMGTPGQDTYTTSGSLTITGAKGASSADKKATLTIGNSGNSTNVVVNGVTLSGLSASATGKLMVDAATGIASINAGALGTSVNTHGILELKGNGSRGAKHIGNVSVSGAGAQLIATAGGGGANQQNTIEGNLGVDAAGEVFAGKVAGTTDYLTVTGTTTVAADGKLTIGGLADGVTTAGGNGTLKTNSLVYNAATLTLGGKGADASTTAGKDGGSGTLNVEGLFHATTGLTVTAGLGGNTDGNDGGGNGGAASVTTKSITADGAFTLKGGTGGDGDASKNGGDGGSATLTITGKGELKALNITGGTAGTGAGNNGSGGNATLTVSGANSSLEATAITLTGAASAGADGKQGVATLTASNGAALNATSITLAGTEAEGALLNIGDGSQTNATTANIGTLTVGSGTAFGTVTLVGASGYNTTVNVDKLSMDFSRGQLDIGGYASLHIKSAYEMASANLVASGAPGKISVAANGTLFVNGAFTLIDASAPTVKTAGNVIVESIVAKNTTAGDKALTVDGTNSGALTLLGTGLADKPLTADGLTLDNGGALVLGSKDTALADRAQGGTIEQTITPTDGSITVANGDWKITNGSADLALGTAGTLTVDGGSLNVVLGANKTLTIGNTGSAGLVVSGGSLDLTGSKGLIIAGNGATISGGNVKTATLDASGATGVTIGGGSTLAKVTVTGTTAADTYKAGTGKVTVSNLGTLSLDFAAVTGSKTSGTTLVGAGGTLYLENVNGKALTTAELAAAKALLAGGSTGLLNLGSGTVAAVANGKAAYADVKNLTSNQLNNTTVTIGASDANTGGVTGGFKNIELTSPSTSSVNNIKVDGTLQLAGGTPDTQLVLGLSGTGTANLAVANNNVLTFGNAAGAAGSKTYGKLTGGVTLANTGSILNAVNGGFSMTGDLDSTNAGSKINLDSADLTVGGAIGGSNTSSVTISNGGTLMGVGEVKVGTAIIDGGNLISAGVAGNVAGDLTVDKFNDGTPSTGDGKVNNATIIAGNDLTVSNDGINAKNVTLNVGGELNVGNGNAIVAADNSHFTVGTLTQNGNAGAITVSGASSLTVGTLTGHSDNITIGTAGADVTDNSVLIADKTVLGTGTLSVLNATASLGEVNATAGGKIFADPAYVNIASFTPSTTVGAALLMGDRGIITVGALDQAWVQKAIAESGAAADSSVLGLQKSIALGAGQIVVDKAVGADGKIGTAVSVPTQKVYFGDKSLLAIDGSQFLDGTKPAAIAITTGGGTFFTSNTAGEAAKLHITSVKTGDTVHVVSGLTNNSVDLTDATKRWQNNNISFDTMLFKGVGSTTDNTDYNVTVHSVGATNIFPKLSHPMGGLVDNVMSQYGLQTDHENAGVRFVSRAVSDSYGLGGHNAERAAATIEGAAQMGAVAGVQISTIGAASVASGAVTTRTSFAQPLMDMTKAVAVHQDADGNLSLDTGLNAGNGPNGGMKSGLGVWIMPLYQSNNTWGQKAENFKSGMSSDLGGIALGADYTINDMFRFGAAFNVGGGYAQSSGDFNETENRFNFWGVNLYGGWTMNNFGLSADVGYTSSFNAVEQDTPAAMAMGNLKADVTTSAWQAGLKGEYKFETSVVDIIPHVGVRYMGLTTDSYDVKSGGTVFGVERDFQSIWTFPIGVAFSKTITSDSGWMFKPMVDLTVIPAAGDLDAKSKASIPGVGGNAEMKMQVVDAVTFDGGLGFEVGKDNLSFGLNYNVQASEHRTGHGVFGTLRYEF